MIPDVVAVFFTGHQEALWLTTLTIDLAGTILLYRLFGKVGLQIAIANANILANMQADLAVQIHGGMGVTWELDVPHYFKRVIAICQMFGNADWHLDRLAE